MDTAILLKRLAEARGPSGYEAEIREAVAKLFRDHAHEVRVDALGNCVALHRAAGPAGQSWFLSSGWQERSDRLYGLAEEVAKKLGGQ